MRHCAFAIVLNRLPFACVCSDEAVEGSSGKPTPSSASHPAKAITTGRQTAHEISSGPSMGIPVHGALSNPAFGASFQSIALSVTGQPSLISAATTPMYVAEVDAGAVHARSAGAIQAVTHGSLEHLALAAHLIEGADTTTTAGVQNTMSMSDTGLKDATGQAVAVLVAPVSQGASAPLGLPSQPRTASPSLSPAPSTASSGGSSVRVSPSSCVIEPDAIRASLM